MRKGEPLRVAISAYVRFANALAWHAYEQAYALHRAGHEVLLFCQAGSPLATRCADATFGVHSELNLHRWSPPEVARNLREVRRALAAFRPDVLHPHCPPGHTYFALAQGVVGDQVPLVRTVSEPRRPKANPINSYLHRRRTDGMIYTTETSVVRYRNLLAGARLPQRVILPGFRANEFVEGVRSAGYRGQVGLSPEVVLAGVIARMSPEKGQEVLIEALSLLSEAERSRLHVVMAGEDSRERGQRQLRALAEQFGVAATVSFLPKLADVRPLMSELELGIITSTTSEAICRVALEYMSFGIPVVSSDVNILPEVVIDGRNGWVFRNRDAAGLAAVLSAAVTSAGDRKSRGAAGSVLVREQFAPEREVAATLELFAVAAAYHCGRHS
ncbi:glycosyltransferase family 4 protein [candidate division KSB1 bacterium]|nr:glycosyltransferase family 4 protein [candidate division KSB1 bacterium]